jgi:hypothetical protein
MKDLFRKHTVPDQPDLNISQSKAPSQKKICTLNNILLKPTKYDNNNIDTSFLLSNKELIDLQLSFENDQKLVSMIDTDGRNDSIHELMSPDKQFVQQTFNEFFIEENCDSPEKEE